MAGTEGLCVSTPAGGLIDMLPIPVVILPPSSLATGVDGKEGTNKGTSVRLSLLPMATEDNVEALETSID